MRSHVLWLTMAAPLCAVASVASVSTSTTTTTASSMFVVGYPYATALPTLQNEVAQCASISGFSFQDGVKPTRAQLAPMCAASSCAAVVNKLFQLVIPGGAVTPPPVASAFQFFGLVMLDFCWYNRVPDEPCPADPLKALVSLVPDKNAACADIGRLSFLEEIDYTVIGNVIAHLQNISAPNRCPSECVELSLRVMYLVWTTPCATPRRMSYQMALSTSSAVVQICNYVQPTVWPFGYKFYPDWPMPSAYDDAILVPSILPLVPVTIVQPTGSLDGQSGSSESDMDNDVDGDQGVDTSSATATRSRVPRPQDFKTSRTDDGPAQNDTTVTPLGVAAETLPPEPVMTGANDPGANTHNPSRAADTLVSPMPVVASTTDTSGGQLTAWMVMSGTAVAVIIVAFLLIVRRRRRESGGDDKAVNSSEDDSFYIDASPSTTGDIETRPSSTPATDAWLQKTVPIDCLQDIRLLGTGGCGVVYLVRDTRTHQLLASKRLITNHQLTAEKLATFHDEIRLIARLDHPCIVAYIGATWTTRSDLQALFEYMDGGDLRTHLDTTPVAPWTRYKLAIAIDVADALVYVHSTLTTPVVHRDLKSRNILLRSRRNHSDDSDSNDVAGRHAKLSDFGVARELSRCETMTTGVGTSRWLAPEVIVGGGSYGTACDMYSFGVVLSELDTHSVPFAASPLPEIALLTLVAAGELAPTFSATCPDDLLQLARSCLAHEPANRPRAETVAHALRTIRASIEGGTDEMATY